MDKFIFLYEKKCYINQEVYNVVRAYADLHSFEMDTEYHNIYIPDFVKKDIEQKLRSLFNKAVDKYVLFKVGDAKLSIMPLRHYQENKKNFIFTEHTHIHYDR